MAQPAHTWMDHPIVEIVCVTLGLIWLSCNIIIFCFVTMFGFLLAPLKGVFRLGACLMALPGSHLRNRRRAYWDAWYVGVEREVISYEAFKNEVRTGVPETGWGLLSFFRRQKEKRRQAYWNGWVAKVSKQRKAYIAFRHADDPSADTRLSFTAHRGVVERRIDQRAEERRMNERAGRLHAQRLERVRLQEGVRALEGPAPGPQLQYAGRRIGWRYQSAEEHNRMWKQHLARRRAHNLMMDRMRADRILGKNDEDMNFPGLVDVAQSPVASNNGPPDSTDDESYNPDEEEEQSSADDDTENGDSEGSDGNEDDDSEDGDGTHAGAVYADFVNQLYGTEAQGTTEAEGNTRKSARDRREEVTYDPIFDGKTYPMTDAKKPAK